MNSKKGESVAEVIVIMVALIISAALIVGCIWRAVENEKNHIDSGIVVDKHHTEEYTSIDYDDDGYPHITEYPARYSLTIRGEKNETEVDYCFSCTEYEYYTYHIGDYYRR